MLYRILAPLDGSHLAESVLPHLVALAKAFDSHVTILRVLDPAGISSSDTNVDPLDWQIRKAEAESYLHEVATRLRESGLHPEFEMIEGKAAESVIEYAHSRGFNLILVSSHGQSGITGWNVSSVVQKIILRSNTSMMIVRAYQPVIQSLDGLHYRRILLPLDGSQRAESVLPVAATLARFHGSQLVAAHVVRQPEMPRRMPLSPEEIELASRIVDKNQAAAFQYLEELNSRYDTNLETRLLVSLSISSTLDELIEQEDIDLVIMSAHGLTGGTKWRYGSTVIGFIAYGTTPLLVIQDLPADRIEPTKAEAAAREFGRH